MSHGIHTPGDRAPGPGWHRLLLQGMQSDNLSAGPGLRLGRGPGGTNLRLRPQPAVLPTPAPVRFRLLDRSTAADGWRLSVYPGTVQVIMVGGGSLVPTLGGDALNDDPRPVAAVSHAEVDVYLRVETDADEEFVAATIQVVDAAGAAPADTFTLGHLLLGTATKAGDAGAPRLTFAPATTGDKAYRKVNTTHLWGAL